MKANSAGSPAEQARSRHNWKDAPKCASCYYLDIKNKRTYCALMSNAEQRLIRTRRNAVCDDYRGRYEERKDHASVESLAKWEAMLSIGGITQRLCWIPPGEFLMGSPQDEQGRYDDEGPQHTVTIAKGFWLADTTCTQALWQAVMDENPSCFKSPTRPVERVSWEEVQEFMARLNSLVPGGGFRLPTEAEWEYACRAGTDTPIYTGPLEIVGERNAPALDPISWYGGNSGCASSEWAEKQYPHGKAGTHPVATKSPNPWGLYDMLGNVLEWTQDHWHYSYVGAPRDGAAWEDGGPYEDRVCRGGEWGGIARIHRSAFRVNRPARTKEIYLGFRIASAGRADDR